MVDFKYNETFERWDALLPYELGDIKELKAVAHIEDGMIVFVETLTINDALRVLNDWVEFKAGLDRNPLDDLKKETHFEPNPDGSKAI